jgi:hypothetical protein
LVVNEQFDLLSALNFASTPLIPFWHAKLDTMPLIFLPFWIHLDAPRNW